MTRARADVKAFNPTAPDNWLDALAGRAEPTAHTYQRPITGGIFLELCFQAVRNIKQCLNLVSAQQEKIVQVLSLEGASVH